MIQFNEDDWRRIVAIAADRKRRRASWHGSEGRSSDAGEIASIAATVAAGLELGVDDVWDRVSSPQKDPGWQLELKGQRIRIHGTHQAYTLRERANRAKADLYVLGDVDHGTRKVRLRGWIDRRRLVQSPVVTTEVGSAKITSYVVERAQLDPIDSFPK